MILDRCRSNHCGEYEKRKEQERRRGSDGSVGEAPSTIIMSYMQIFTRHNVSVRHRAITDGYGRGAGRVAL